MYELIHNFLSFFYFSLIYSDVDKSYKHPMWGPGTQIHLKAPMTFF